MSSPDAGGATVVFGVGGIVFVGAGTTGATGAGVVGETGVFTVVPIAVPAFAIAEASDCFHALET